MVTIDNKSVDIDTLSISAIDTRDYPNFTDAYVDYAQFEDHTPLDAKQLKKLTRKYPTLAQDMLHNQYSHPNT